MKKRDLYMHEGHRMRMKNKFLESRFRSFETHEILEFLLHFVIPRRDTNAVAHKLINTFDGFSPIFDAEMKSIERVNGLGENSAIFIKTMYALMNIYENEKREQNENKNKWSYLENFLVKEFKNHGFVTFCTLCDNKFNILKNDVLTEGSIYKFESYKDKIANSISFYNAEKVLISSWINIRETRLSKNDIDLIREIKATAKSVTTYV